MQGERAALVAAARALIEPLRDTARAAVLARYMKNAFKFYGLSRPLERELFRDFSQSRLADVPGDERIRLVFDFLRDEYGELKFFGALLLERNVLELLPPFYPEFGEVVATHCPSWCIIDSLGSALKKKIQADQAFPGVLEEWSRSPNPWKQRLSCVSFVTLARHGAYNAVIYRICDNAVRNPHRFVQLGAGWVLRELSLCDLKGVKSFLRRNYALWSREGLRYAIEKMAPADRDALLHYTPKGAEEGEDEPQRSKKRARRA